MQLTESSIYINLKRLRNLLYEAQFRMTTANRVVFGNTLMKYSAETISNFILAFTVGDKKLEYLELSLGYFAVLRDRVYPNTRIVKRGKEKARSFNLCVRESKTDSLLASLNSYLGICKGVNGYRQALSIVRELSSEWNKYVEFDRHRCCLVARDSNRNRIIKKFNLK